MDHADFCGPIRAVTLDCSLNIFQDLLATNELFAEFVFDLVESDIEMANIPISFARCKPSGPYQVGDRGARLTGPSAFPILQ
jgi:hypothetical protein